MKELVQEYGLILVGVAAILICLLFGKQVFQHDIKGATVSNIAKLTQNNDSFNGYVPGTTLSVEGHEVIVLEKKEDEKYLVMEKKSIGYVQFQPNQDSSGNYENVGSMVSEPNIKYTRYDGQNTNTYENSYIDKYLENTWYQTLPAKLKDAIIISQIKQESLLPGVRSNKWKNYSPTGGTPDWYYNEGDDKNQKWVIYSKASFKEGDTGVYPFKDCSILENGYNNQAYNMIERHAYLPSIKDMQQIVDLNSAESVRRFLNGTKEIPSRIWLRDSKSDSARFPTILNINYCSIDFAPPTHAYLEARPTYVLDTSKVDVEVTGVLNYK